MADKTGIEWTDATWNPVTGCSKVSSGCKHCYAERDWARLSANPETRYFNRLFTDVQVHGDMLSLPVRWAKPRRIFVNSMSDLFHVEVTDGFIANVFAVMAACPQHTFQVLTKRPERMLDLLGGKDARWIAQAQQRMTEAGVIPAGAYTVRWPLPNVWIGVSVEDQEAADERIPLLLRTPAAVRWISAEPLLGHVDLGRWIGDEDCYVCGARFFGDEIRLRLPAGPEQVRVVDFEDEPDDENDIRRVCPACGQRDDCGEVGPVEEEDLGGGLNWVIVGGESGPKARPMHPYWVRSLRDQCAAAGVPFLFKQWGEHAPYDRGAIVGTNLVTPNALDTPMQRFGKKLAGRLLDGVEHNGYPEVKP